MVSKSILLMVARTQCTRSSVFCIKLKKLSINLQYTELTLQPDKIFRTFELQWVPDRSVRLCCSFSRDFSASNFCSSSWYKIKDMYCKRSHKHNYFNHVFTRESSFVNFTNSTGAGCAIYLSLNFRGKTVLVVLPKQSEQLWVRYYIWIVFNVNDFRVITAAIRLRHEAWIIEEIKEKKKHISGVKIVHVSIRWRFLLSASVTHACSDHTR